MPVMLSYPGVYIEEIASGVRTIVGVATSIGAFVDFFARVGQPIDPQLKHIVAWHERMKARPSADA